MPLAACEGGYKNFVPAIAKGFDKSIVFVASCLMLMLLQTSRFHQAGEGEEYGHGRGRSRVRSWQGIHVYLCPTNLSDNPTPYPNCFSCPPWGLKLEEIGHECTP